VISKELDKKGIPNVLITALSMVGKQFGANRIVLGTKIPHPCGDPNLNEAADQRIRRKIIELVLELLQTEVTSPTVCFPKIIFTSG
jgi:glycine/betaine/sarcosine/D-proline reductase family selenoprotein B